MTTVPTIKFVFDRRHRATSSHEGSVELRITFERRMKFITTGIRLLPKQWLERTQTVTNRADAKELNGILDALLTKVRKIIYQMLEEGNLCLDEIPHRMKDDTRQDTVSFLDFCRQRLEVRMYGKQERTVARYERFLRWLTQWGEIKFFTDITDENIIKMDKELTAARLKDYSKWTNYHRHMNSFILDAIDAGMIKRNPYKWVNIQKGRTYGLQKYLTIEELMQVERAIMPTKSLERVRDLFVFQSYTCLSYIDLEGFDTENIKEINGTTMYTARRGKTGQEFTLVLLRKAKEILNKYDGKLPMISNVKYNAYIKLVMQAAKIDKPVTSHWARHTGATILLNEGKVDMEIIARILGHSSTRQTRETYAKLLDTTIATAMTKLDKVI